MPNIKNYDNQLNLPVGSEFVEKINQLIKKLEKINENDLKVKIDLTGYITSLEIVRDYQKRLISGTNIKTINDQTILGPGNIKIESEVKRNEFGNLIDLNTSAKNNIVSAVNELDRLIDDLTNSKANKSEVNSTINSINLEISNLKTLINNLNSSKANQNEVNTVKSDLNTVQNKVNTIASSYIKSVSYVESTGLFTFTLQDGTTKSIDLAIEKVVANFVYDSNTNNLVLTLADGTKQTVPLTGLVDDFDGVDGQTIKVTVSSDNKISAEVKGKVIGEEHLTDELLNKINEGAGSSVVGPEKYLKDVEYNSSDGIITFTLQDDTKKQVDIPIEKTVKSFELIQGGGTPTDLTGYTVTVPAGWSASQGYGEFSLLGTYVLPSSGNVINFSDSYANFKVGFYNDRTTTNAITCVSSVSGSNNYFSASSNIIINITGGASVTNSKLIQWFVNNNATFEKETSSTTLRLTLNDDTYFDVNLELNGQGAVDAYTKEESDNRYASKTIENQTTNLTTKVTNIENSYIKSVAYEPTTGIFTFILQDSSIRTVDLAIEKVVTNFEYVANYVKKEPTPADLTGYAVIVPAGWSANQGYGTFKELSFTLFNNSSNTEFGVYSGIAIGYFYSPNTGSTFAYKNYISLDSGDSDSFGAGSYGTSYSFRFSNISGTDTTNQNLIQWFVNNGATFTKDSPNGIGESGLLLTLADGTSTFISLANFIKDYTGKDGDQIQINIINHEISAILKDGSITSVKLADEVKNSFASKETETKANTLETNLSGLQDRVTSLEQNQGSGSGGGAVSASIFETVVVEDFSGLEEAQGPYTHFADITLTNSLDNKASIELLNNNAVLFATYGFAIASISSGNVVTVYSINKPSESVTLTFEIVKAYKVWDGSYTEGAGASLITFTIDGTTYQAEEGMTWGEWVDSSYNNGVYVLDSGGLYIELASDTFFTVGYNDAFIKSTDVIENKDYVLISQNPGGSN